MDNMHENDTNVAEDGVKTTENDAIPEENSDGSQEMLPDNPVFSAPLTRDSKGRFTKGTGSRGHLGGRPKGAKDKISRQLIEICSDLVADKGSEILEHLAKTDPAAAMAICLKVVPNSEWVQAHTEERQGDSSAGQDVTIRLVSAPSPQTRLEAPVSRITHEGVPTDTIIEHAAREASEAPVGPTQEELDREAAEAERERKARLNEQIRAHGGLTGKPSRSAAPDTLDYPEDGVI